jgi:hypothetical protein
VHYVYLIESIADPSRRYVGSTADLKQRFKGAQFGKFEAHLSVRAVSRSSTAVSKLAK